LGDKLVYDDKGVLRYSYWLGVPISRTFANKVAQHTCTVVSNLSLFDVVRGGVPEASMLGYMAKCFAPVLGKTYLVDAKRLSNHESRVITSLKSFDYMLDKLADQEFVAVDTEATSLNKIVNTLLTIQFAYTQDFGYLVPIHHKDSPFTGKEISRVKDRLRDFFEYKNNNKYHIYANAKFDLTLLKTACDIDYFKNSLWDIFGAEFAFDENMKFLDNVIGEYYYSLGNLSVQYGFEGYLNAEFSKQHRAMFYKADLNSKAVQHYTTLDVVVPIAIHLQQKKRAQDKHYTKYEGVVRNEISDTIHSFSVMEHTGAGLDVDYLFYLYTPNSPIVQEIKNMENQLLKTEAVKKANRILSKQAGIPTDSLFKDVAPVTAFKLSKPDHKKLLFFKVLGLKPLDVGKNGVGKLDKAFQAHYADVPEVAQYTALEKAKKLRNAYVRSFIKLLGTSEDLRKTHRIRPTFKYLNIVTHRGAASNPNLQQVPSHSALGKHIKRLFVAREGTLYIKVDYRVHEVRGWGLISFDKGIAEVFKAAKKLRDAYRKHPTPELAKKLKTEADVHIQNASYFFRMSMEDVTKELRSAVKGIIFGLIYGMGLKTLAGNINQTLEFTEDLVRNFSKRFVKAMAWTKNVKKFAAEHLYVEAPSGIRRNLFGYLLPSSFEDRGAITSRMDRQAGNAPVQGMCSKFMMNGMRILDRVRHKIKETRPDFGHYMTNSVHDSLEIEAAYANFLKSISITEWSLTHGVRAQVKKRYGFELVCDLEVDFEIGCTLSQCDSWDFSVAQLETLVMDSLLFQRNKLKHNINPDKVMKIIFSKRAIEEDAPAWMKEQIQELNYKFELTEQKYVQRILHDGKEKEKAAQALLEEANEKSLKKEAKDAASKLAAATDLVAYALELRKYGRNRLTKV
jgi:DNA polymerase I-like protein with 3'-5' exonuclease and polymerase domains